MYTVRTVMLQSLPDGHHETRPFVRPGGTGPWKRWPHDERMATFDAALLQLWVAFQPIVDIKTSTPVYFEALVRSAEERLQKAKELVGLAVELGRTHDIASRVHRGVVSLLESRQDVTAFVNVDIEELVSGVGAATDPLSPFATRVVLELTERAALHELPEFPARIRELRAQGFRFAIDDLGGGYAGLASLAATRPEFVKIDQALVRGIEADCVKRKIVGTILALCSDLNVQCIVEGVETHEERAALETLGATLMQGFLFAEPKRFF